MGFRTWQEAAVWSVGLFLAFAFLLIVSAFMFRLSFDAWSVTHGSGHPGSWVAVERDDGGRVIHWYGDFTSADGSPNYDHVLLDGINGDLKVGDTVHVTYGGRPPQAYRGTTGWVIRAFAGVCLGALAAGIGWLVVHHMRRPRERTDSPAIDSDGRSAPAESVCVRPGETSTT